MVILGIDTSTSAIGVGLGRDGETLASAQRIDARGHSEHLAPLIVELLRDNGLVPRDLDAIAVGNGPGPFTGLRVGLVTAVTMGHALGIPVHGVCSLDVLAVQAGRPEGELLVATDARRKEVYWARYAVSAAPRAAFVSVTRPAVDRPGDLAADVRALPVVGRGASLYPELLPHPLELPLDVDAGVLLEVAGPRIVAGEDLQVTPLYLRRPDALTTAERAAGR